MKWTFLLLLPLFFACQPPKEVENTISINISEPPSKIDPRLSHTVPDMNIMKMLFEGLVREDPTGNLSLALAETITPSEDNLTYTFTLRPSIWSDGSPLTANDFVTSWSEILTPDFPAPYASLFYIIKNGEQIKKGILPKDSLGIKVKDTLTFEVTLEHPAPYFLNLVALPPFYPTAHNSLLTNGPFIIDEWKEFDVITLKKNHYFWDATHVPLSGINLYMVSEHTEEALFDNGKLSWSGSPITNISSDTIAKLTEENKISFSPALGTHYFICNTHSSPFKNPKIRQAFAYALNRKEIVEHVLQGGQSAALGFLPPPLNVSKNSYFKDYQPQKARQLFAEVFAGDDIPEITFIYATNERNHKIAQAVQQQWNRVFGIKVNIKALEGKIFLEAIKKGEYQIANASWIGDFNDPVNFLELFQDKNSPLNKTLWENKTYQKHLKASQISSSSEERILEFKQAEEILMKEFPIIPLFFYTFSYRKSPQLSGVYLSPLGQLDFRWAKLTSQ